MCPLLYYFLFPKGASQQELHDQLYQSSINRTHTHSHPFQSPCCQTQLQAKNLNTHILSNIHGYAHTSVSTVERLSNYMSCQSHSHSYLQMPNDGRKDCLFLFIHVTTHVHTAQFYVFSFHWYVFPQYVRLNRNQSSVCTLNGIQELKWNALITKNINLSDWD